MSSEVDGSSPDLMGLLTGGGSVEVMLFELLPAPTKATLMRCAVVREFDRGLYEQVLRSDDGPELEELLDEDLVDATDEGTHTVADLREVAYLSFWTAEDRPAVVTAPIPGALQATASRCAEWFAQQQRPLAHLDALLQCDVRAAGHLLRSLFTRADQDHDLAACQDVLDVIEQRDRFPICSGTELADLHLECRARLAARTRWASDYSASARYFCRPGLERELEKLFASPPLQVLQLFARGGMGKTMQLRWLLGRRCSAQWEHVPAASVDFDHEDASRATRNPWLVALRIAEQLEGQLVGDHFRAVLESHGGLVPLLYADPKGGPSPLPPMPDDIDGRDVVGRIAAVLAERPVHKPVVVVVDTCEELLRPGIEPCGLFAMLADLVRQAPALRLVLAGRYDLTIHESLLSRGCRVAELFPSMETRLVSSFDAADRRRYLVELRKLPAGELVDVIVERTGQSPFHLATFADLARLDEDMTADSLRRTEEPGMLYLIERILKRVEPDVRWLLLYGVVPRRLSVTFVRDVMLPFLVEGMQDTSPDGLATPALSILPLMQTPPPESEGDIDELWRRMLGYASRYSWVWVDEEGDLRFHPDVLEPLRSVARRSPFYRDLHEKAISHFEHLASRDQDRWAVWTAEALYHRFQLEGPAAASDWQEALSRAWTSGSNDAVLLIADEPLRREYLDEDDEPRPFGDESIITWDVVVSAHVHLALAIADRAGGLAPVFSTRRALGPTSQWTEVQRHLSAARQIATLHGIALPQPETDLAETRAAIATGSIRRAADLVMKGDLESAARSFRPMIELTQRFVRHLLGESDPWSGFEETWAETGAADQPRVGLQVALGRAAAASDRQQHVTALKWLRTASELDATGDDDRRISMHADALTASGSPAAAVALLTGATGPLSSASLVQALLAADLPTEGLAAAHAALASVPLTEGELHSSLYRLRSAAHAQLLHVDEAHADLHTAKANARSFHDPSAEALAASQMCLLHLREIGDLRNAAACLEDALDTSAQEGSPGWLSTQLARAEWQARNGQVQAAELTLDDIRTGDEATAVTIQLAVMELVIGSKSEDVAHRLADHLIPVEPPPARLVVLGDLSQVPTSAIDMGGGEALLSAVSGSLDASEGLDRASLGWRCAELHRVVGDVEGARRLLLDEVMPATDTNPFLWWRLLGGMRRCGLARPEDPVFPEDPFQEHPEMHGLRAAWLLQLVQWRGHLETTSWCRQRLEEAEGMLQRPRTLPTHWRAQLDEARAMLDEREGSLDNARQSAATASVMWARLGQAGRRAKIAATYELGVVEAAGADEDVELRLWFGEGVPDRADIHAQVTSEGVPLRAGRVERTLLLDQPRTHVRDSSTRLRAVSARIATDWDRWAETVGRSVASSGLTTALAQSAGDLRLVTGHPELAAMPWELLSPPQLGGVPLPHAVQPRRVYRCVDAGQRDELEVTAAQAALELLGFFPRRVDGLVGPATREAVREFQTASGLPPSGRLTASTWIELRRQLMTGATSRPLRVAIVGPPSQDAGSSTLPAMVELTALYSSRGALVRKVELNDLLGGRAVSKGAEEKPDVVHLLATVDLVGGNVVVDTGAAASRRRSRGFGLDQLSVTVLGDYLAATSNESFGPAVVIETPWRPSRTEAARSLLLRNVLGHALLSLGRTEAVLCTGGAAPSRQHLLRKAMVDALVSHSDLSEVAGLLQTSAPPESGLEDAVSGLGSALFLQRSPRTLFPVGSG